jgi:hypothetical protein
MTTKPATDLRLCDRGEHYDCGGCRCTCHPRADRPPDKPGGLGPQTGMTGVTWHPDQEEMWSP